MKKNLYSIVLFVLISLLLVGCENKNIEPIPVSSKESLISIPRKEDPNEKNNMEENEDGSDELMPEIEKSTKTIARLVDSVYENEKKNVVLSDTSLNMALGMAMEGASGEALDSLSDYYNTDVETLGKYNRILLKKYEEESLISMNVFNGVYTNEGLQTFDSFKKNVKKNYNADVESLNFSDPESADYINNVCKENTNDLIDGIVTSDNLSSCEAIILDALYFKAPWGDPFLEDQIKDIDFSGIGETKTVSGMYGSGGIYYECDNATAFAKLYKDAGYSFIGILPKENIVDETGDFKVSDIDIDTLLDSKAYDYDVDFMVPKFKIEDTNNLTSALSEMGLSSLFDGQHSCFENMSDAYLYFDSVIQKTVVDVNEEGTEAAAVTAGMVCMAAAPIEKQVKEVYLNRPFVFMIYDDRNDEVLFIGKVVNL